VPSVLKRSTCTMREGAHGVRNAGCGGTSFTVYPMSAPPLFSTSTYPSCDLYKSFCSPDHLPRPFFLLSPNTLHSKRRPVLPTTLALVPSHTHHLTFNHNKTALQTVSMFGFTLYQSACVYASVTAFSATWVALALPIQHGKVGPFNYHRAIKRGARIPWRRIPGMKI
jgi:hypothetical protein